MRHGSLQNHLIGTSEEECVLPEVGDGATMIHWSDRSPHSVIHVGGTEKRPLVIIQADYAKAKNDVMNRDSGQEWEITRTPHGFTNEVYWRKGQWMTRGGNRVIFGRREMYRDPTM